MSNISPKDKAITQRYFPVISDQNKLTIFEIDKLSVGEIKFLADKIKSKYEPARLHYIEFYKGKITQSLISLLQLMDSYFSDRYELRFSYMCVNDSIFIEKLVNLDYIHFIDTPENKILIDDSCKNLRDITFTGNLYEVMPQVDRIAPLFVPEIYFNDANWLEITNEDMGRLLKFENLKILGLSHCKVERIADGYFPNLRKLFLSDRRPEMGMKMEAMLRLADVVVDYHRCYLNHSSLYAKNSSKRPSDKWEFRDNSMV